MPVSPPHPDVLLALWTDRQDLKNSCRAGTQGASHKLVASHKLRLLRAAPMALPCRTPPTFCWPWSITTTSLSGLSPEEGRGHLQRPCVQQLISESQMKTVENKEELSLGSFLDFRKETSPATGIHGLTAASWKPKCHLLRRPLSLSYAHPLTHLRQLKIQPGDLLLLQAPL